MKFVLVLLGLGATVVAVLAVQALSQEMSIRALRSRMSESVLDSQKKEGDIADLKRKANDNKALLETAQNKLDGLKAQKAQLEQSKSDSETNLKTCAEEKVGLEIGRRCWHRVCDVQLFNFVFEQQSIITPIILFFFKII